MMAMRFSTLSASAPSWMHSRLGLALSVHATEFLAHLELAHLSRQQWLQPVPPRRIKVKRSVLDLAFPFVASQRRALAGSVVFGRFTL
jgi:hypothetical protein